MKSKKSKTKPNIHMILELSPEEFEAAACAVEFALASPSFDCTSLKINSVSADAAFDKLLHNETEYTRGEIRATHAALRFSLSCSIEDSPDDQELCRQLNSRRSILVALMPRYQAFVDYLKKLR